jgi:hypothetical protein
LLMILKNLKGYGGCVAFAHDRNWRQKFYTG